MKISFLIIGSEILLGRILETNLKWLGNAVLGLGHTLQKALIVSDEEESLVKTIRETLKECDILITSGGLGPTPDDLTKGCVAKALGQPVVYKEEAFQLASFHYQRIGRKIPSSNHPYGEIPQNFSPVPNPCGLAPGLKYFDQSENKLLFCAPGVPKEFQEMMETEFFPQLSHYFPSPKSQQKILNFRTQFLPEEKLFKEIAPELWTGLSRWGKVSSLPHTLGVDIGVHLVEASEAALAQKEREVVAYVEQSPIAPSLWQIGDLPLPNLIVSLCRKLGLTFSFAESCSGGNLANLITDVPGSSEVFRGSVVSYQTVIKENLLGVPEKILEENGVVSREVALAMALGVRSLLKTHISLSTTGIAGPSGGSEKIPVGTVAMGICSESTQTAHLLHYQGDRRKLKEIFTLRALFFLLEEIRNLEKHMS